MFQKKIQKMNSSIKTEQNFKKKMGEYFISFCQTEYYGKSLHGQMRAGHHQSDNKVYIFRINPLPLSNSMISFLNVQKTYSELKQFARMVYEDLSSSSFNYTVLQFFPKTFQTEIVNFRKNSKYFDQMIEKFLKTYSFFFNMKIAHANLIPSNIGITFDGKVKLMDFQCPPQQIDQQKLNHDFQSFKDFVGRVLQKDANFPYKFSSFNSKQNSKWQHVFSSWHITSPLQPVYLARKHYVENIVTSLYKLDSSLDEIYQKFQQTAQYQSQNQQKQQSQIIEQKQPAFTFILTQQQKLNDLRMAIRLLQLNYLTHSKQQKLKKQQKFLQQIISPLQENDIDYYNSVLIGAIRDFQFYLLDPSRRLVLLSCLIPILNHQYIHYQIAQQFKENQSNMQRNLLLGDSLFNKFKNHIFQNLLRKPFEKKMF